MAGAPKHHQIVRVIDPQGRIVWGNNSEPVTRLGIKQRVIAMTKRAAREYHVSSWIAGLLTLPRRSKTR